MMRDNRMIGIICGVLVVILFSGFTLVSRLGFSSSLTLLDIAALRFGIGGALLLPVLLRYGLSGLKFRDALAISFLGGLGFALFAYAGFLLAPASHGAVLLHGTLPLFTFAISRQRAEARQSTGVALVGAGVALMAYDSLTGTNLNQLIGDGFLLLASLCWSSYGVLVRRLNLAPARAAAVVAVSSMCCFLPVYVILRGSTLFLASPQELVLQSICQGVLIGALSIFIYTRAVAALGATETALFTAAVPCVTTLAAMPVLSEFPSMTASAGVAVVTLGMIVGMGAATKQR